MPVQNFEIDVPESAVRDLKDRLSRTRWPDQIRDAGWDYGTNREYLEELTAYWLTDFDWYARQAELNRFSQFQTQIDGLRIHFIHERSAATNALPLLLIHGWPDSVFRMQKLIPRLTQRESQAAVRTVAFDVVAPSIPGFGFSEGSSERGMSPARIARLFHTLMTEQLGYTQYAVHGGDWGSTIADQLARQQPQSVVAIHMTDVPFMYLMAIPAKELSDPEKQYIERGKQWRQTEAAYAMIQGSKPQTLGHALDDSPAGLASWIVEKFRSWSDCDGDVEKRFTKDELLTNISLYWFTASINSSLRIYYEQMRERPPQHVERLATPTGVAIFPKDIVSAPREYAQRFFNVRHWTAMPRGGHFAALEEPDLLAQDLRDFLQIIRH